MHGFNVQRLEGEHVEHQEKQVGLLPLPVVSHVGNFKRNNPMLYLRAEEPLTIHPTPKGVGFLGFFL